MHVIRCQPKLPAGLIVVIFPEMVLSYSGVDNHRNEILIATPMQCSPWSGPDCGRDETDCQNPVLAEPWTEYRKVDRLVRGGAGWVSPQLTAIRRPS